VLIGKPFLLPVSSADMGVDGLGVVSLEGFICPGSGPNALMREPARGEAL